MVARSRLRRKRLAMPFWIGTMLACALAAGITGLSAAQPGAASDAPAATPSGATGGEPAKATEAPAIREALSARSPIALVLPLESKTFGRAADAVKAGFLAAAAAAQENPLVLGHDDGDVVAAFAKAVESGARLLVGPLVRDDLKALAAASLDLPPTIALNQPDEGVVLPPAMYTLALAVESDARSLARRARADGAQTVTVIASDAPLHKRFASAFNAEWILAGGGAPSLLRFESAPEALALLKRNLARAPTDAALLALDGASAAQVKPYLGTIAVYAGSPVNDRPPLEMRRDLDDVRFVDVPWLLDPEFAAFANYARAPLPNATLDRLYALGIDAFRVAQAFENGPPARLDFDGATGRVFLDAPRQFAREGRLARFRAGEVVLLDGR
jgi:hypothetical protein